MGVWTEKWEEMEWSTIEFGIRKRRGRVEEGREEVDMDRMLILVLRE